MNIQRYRLHFHGLLRTWSNRVGTRPGFIPLSLRPKNSMATDTHEEVDKAPGAFVREKSKQEAVMISQVYRY